MMKTACVFIVAFVGVCASFAPPVAESPVVKEEATCESGSIKGDLAEMRQKVLDILTILERIEGKQSELTNLTYSYERLTDQYDTLLDAVNKLLGQECNGDSDAGDDQAEPENVCISSCDGRLNGDYQSCLGCTVYATCSNQILYDDRPCAEGFDGPLVWDDGFKECRYESTTCVEAK